MKNVKDHKDKIIICFALAVILAVLVFFVWKKDETVKLPVPNEAEYTKPFNEWAREVVREAKNKTPEKKALEEAYWGKILKMKESSLKDITFYGKVVDQYNNPVSGVTLSAFPTPEYLASTAGGGRLSTDSEGMFFVEGVTGLRLSIARFGKLSYQFPKRQVFGFSHKNHEKSKYSWQKTFAVWREDFNKLDNLTKYEGLLFPHLLIEIELVRNCESGISVNYIFSNDIQGATKGGYNFIDVFVGNYVGKILTPLYKNKELSLRTLVFVKSSFLIKFIKVWLLNIKVKKNNNFAIDNNKLLFRYFKFYPQLYYVYFYIHTYPYFNYIKLNLKSIFNKN